MKVVIHTSPPAKVTLLAVGAGDHELALVTRGYSQVYESSISEEEITQFLQDLGKTKLQTPNAFVNTIWLLRNVTRNFEQQLTRYRVGTAFVCESLRFSDKRDAQFYDKTKTREGSLVFNKTARDAISAYETMVAVGEATQDARDVLPGSICTHLFFSVNLQTLAHIYEQRACCQAQAEEWHEVLFQMRLALADEAPTLIQFLKAPWDNPNCVSCGFGASFDRPCLHQQKFDDNLRVAAHDRGML